MKTVSRTRRQIKRLANSALIASAPIVFVSSSFSRFHHSFDTNIWSPTIQVGRDYPPPVDVNLDLGSLDENAFRLIKYEFSEDVLRLPSIQVLYTSRAYNGTCLCSVFSLCALKAHRARLIVSRFYTLPFCLGPFSRVPVYKRETIRAFPFSLNRERAFATSRLSLRRSAQTSLVFSVGNQAVSNFRMVERHYFRDQVRVMRLL